MGMGIDGLASGLDTTSIINALMNAAAIPQTQMKTKVSTDTYLLNALQALNTKFAALTTQSSALAKPDGLAKYQVASSSPAITATLSANAKPISLDLSVTALAQAHSVVTAPLQKWPSSPPVLTFVKDGVQTEITPESDSLDDVAYAINKSAAGVSAAKIAVGTDDSGNALYRLQLTSSDTGSAGTFSIYQGTGAEVTAGTAPDLAGTTVLRAGQDAQVTMWAGTTAEQTITSGTNTFTALAPGLDVTVHQISANPVSLNVTRDASQVTTAATDLVSNVNIILGSIFTQSAVSSAPGATGSAAVTGGLFTSNSTTAAAKDRLFTAVVSPVNGLSPSTIGINSTKNGDFTFDADAFAAAYAKDPALVESTLQTIAGRVADAAKAVSDPYDGTLSQSIKGKQTVINDFNNQILKWDDRLAQRRSALTAVYAKLEVQLGKMQSQQNWLSSQISSFDSASSSKK